ncbi:MAG TPA: TrmH family RNA methyltransferase [Candidatus Paceibacterota bacterium]|nr:TrmH family RNA methyltransferase [Candidatus Paceibacterota bacterium]
MKQISGINSVLILPDIRSAINVGAIFRTADAVGISKIYLTGYTPRPTDKFGRIQKDIAKSALGAENFVEWEYKKSLPAIISKLRREGYKIIAIEQDKRAVDYRKVFSKVENKKIAIILGPEVTGLPKNILDKCDIIAEIPMYGKKESLNVSVACGIALFRILRN